MVGLHVAQSLRQAVKATGGPARWGPELGVVLPKGAGHRHRWTCPRMRNEVARIAGDNEDWPPYTQFRDAGLLGLHGAIREKGARG